MRNRPIPNVPENMQAMVRDLVIYEDQFLLAFNKPSGLAVQTRGNRGTSLDHLLWTFARSNGKRPHLVHRIDAGTSGLIIAAKTKPAMTALSAEFAERRVRKTYLALVSGAIPEKDAGRIETPLLKVGRAVKPGLVEQRADAAQTDWRVLKRFEAYALIQAMPRTGRMHQIRAHLADLGSPILGDPIYGAGALTGPRLMLHAAGLKITFPDKKKLALEAPVPDDFVTMQAEIGL
ncbi:MAG: RluA family pseudouridine synthase [Hyphomonadaceae bacterium]|nr:RluA family pseudouridine synthase [Hyphomonadaceae bacterium]